MRHLKYNIAGKQRGFTLIELVVVIAILGILATIAVPVITSYLGSSKERAYNADQARFQVAVDAYFSSPSNDRFTGKRQYPTYAQVNKGTSGALLEASATSAEITTLGTTDTNPVGGTKGGTPYWEDIDGNGVRPTSGETLFYHSATTTPSGDHWNTTKVTRGGTDYMVDSQDWFVNFAELVSDGLLDSVPRSASPDNDSGATGSYSWYVDASGKIRSIFYFYPLSTESGFQQETYP